MQSLDCPFRCRAAICALGNPPFANPRIAVSFEPDQMLCSSFDSAVPTCYCFHGLHLSHLYLPQKVNVLAAVLTEQRSL